MKLYLTDIDNTILPLEEKQKVSSQLLKKWENRVEDYKVGYTTGRQFDFALKALKELPKPDFLVSDVGTRISFKEKKRWKKDKNFSGYISGSWRGEDREKIKEVLSSIKQIEEQELDALSCFKQSYYLDLDYNSQKVIKRIKKKLKEANLKSKVVYSVDKTKNKGLIDVLPKKSGKKGAIQFLMKKFDLNLDQVLYSGDSGNDLEALSMGFFSILVGNAREEIKKQLKNQASDKDKIYIAQKNYVEGILEGFDHFGF